MIHERIVVPIRTNRNKLNSSVPFKVSVSGSTKPTIYYDLATGFLKFKIRMTDVKFDETPIWWQELNIIGVDSYGMEDYNGEKIQSFDLVVKLVKEGKLSLDGFITHRFKMSEYKKGFSQCLKHPRETIKVVLENDL